MGYRHQSAPAVGDLPDGGHSTGDRPSFSPLQSVCVSACVTALKGYKVLISPWLPSACRFHPTCSDYARQAIETHGVFPGVWLAIKRLSKCHPYHKGGFDPVPPTEQ